MRLTTSCSVCRFRKKRCVLPESSSSCTFCVGRGLDCSLRNDDSPAIDVPPSASSASGSHVPVFSALDICQTSSPDLQSYIDQIPTCSSFLQLPICDELLDLYFDLIHNKQHILFHRWTFEAERKAGILPDYLLLGIVALVARFSSSPFFRDVKPWARAETFLRQALQAFHARPTPITTQALQGSILLSFVCFVEGLHDQEALLAAQAICMVQILRLPHELSADPILREIQLRLFWQTWMMDTWNCARSQRPRQVIAEGEFPRPLEEEHFEGLRPGACLGLDFGGDELRRSSLWTCVIQLTETFAQIVQLNHQIVHQSELAFTADTRVHAITMQLDRWLQNLPEHLKNTPENLKTFVNRGRGREFAVPHLIYHYQGQLLYYRYLSKACSLDNKELDPKAIVYAARCKAHSEALSTLMWSTNTTHGVECLWSPVNGHLLVIASTIHLHSLLMDQDPLREIGVRKLLEQNFVMLLQFQKFWPSLETSMSRLQAFHMECQMDSQQLKSPMDSWTLDFLDRYDLPIRNRSKTAEERSNSFAARDRPSPAQAEDFWYGFSQDARTASRALNASLSFQ